MFKLTMLGIRQRLHKDGRVEWTVTVNRGGKRWVAKGFSTKQEALAGQRRLAISLDSNQLSWVTPRLLSVQEAATLLSQAEVWLVGPILMSLFAGLRASEIVALRCDDMDVNREQLRVAGQRSGQTREFPLPKPLAMLCWICQYAAPAAPSLFEDGLGKPLSQAVLHHAFRETSHKAGLADLRFQDLRHTFAAWAMQARLPVTLIAAMLGVRRMTAPWLAKYLVALEQRSGLTTTSPANQFAELSRLIVEHPDDYPPFLVALFISPRTPLSKKPAA
jgi:integrase